MPRAAPPLGQHQQRARADVGTHTDPVMMWHTSVSFDRSAVNSPGPHSHTPAFVESSDHTLRVASVWLLRLVGFGCGVGSSAEAALS